MITLTATPDYDELLPSVLLTVTTSPSVTAPLDIVRVHADGTEHRLIVANRQQVIGGWADRDHHCPFNQTVTYRAQVGSDIATAPAYVGSMVPWLISPDQPETSLPIRVKSIGDRSKESRSAALRPVGGQLVAISDTVRDGITASMVIEVDDEEPLSRLLEENPVLLVNTPGAGWRIKWMWALIGQLTYVNPGRAHWPTEQITLPLTEVAAPDVDLVSDWTSGIAAATFAAEGKTSGGIVSLYADSLALVTDTRL